MAPDSIFNYTGTILVIIGLPLLGIIARFCGVSFKRITKWYMYAAVFAVVVVVNSILFPFIGGKDYFFRFATELGLIAALLWWAFEAKAGEAKQMIHAAFKRPIVKAATAFAIAFELACIFAFDAHAAFWSNYERGEGGFEMLHYYLFFILLVLFFQYEEDWKNIFKFSLIAAGGMILYGVGANLGIISTWISPYAGGTPPTGGWWHLLIDGRFEGSLGNPAYVDPYLIFSMFFAAYLWLSSKIVGKMTTAKAWGYGVLILVFLFFFYLGETRGAFLGLAAGLFIGVVYLAFVGSRKVRKWSLVTIAILVILGAGIFAVRNEPFLNNIPGGRLAQISLSDATAQTRFWVWDEAWKGFLERPVFGWGPENFTAVFDKFFNPNFYVPGQNTETWFDRAHSVFFDYLAETGIIGLLAYLSMFLMFARDFFRRKKQDIAPPGEHQTARVLQNALMLAMPVAYLVQGVAIFDVLPMYIPLFLFLAFASFYFSRTTPTTTHHESHV
jgi:O-antigen ligase